MNAIISIGGNQHQVSTGMHLMVEGLNLKVGETVKAPVLLYWDQDIVKIGRETKQMEARLKILKVENGTKVIIRRFRHKVRHRRQVGFRSLLTTFEVENIVDTEPKSKPISKTG